MLRGRGLMPVEKGKRSVETTPDAPEGFVLRLILAAAVFGAGFAVGRFR